MSMKCAKRAIGTSARSRIDQLHHSISSQELTFSEYDCIEVDVARVEAVIARELPHKQVKQESTESDKDEGEKSESKDKENNDNKKPMAPPASPARALRIESSERDEVKTSLMDAPDLIVSTTIDIKSNLDSAYWADLSDGYAPDTSDVNDVYGYDDDNNYADNCSGGYTFDADKMEPSSPPPLERSVRESPQHSAGSQGSAASQGSEVLLSSSPEDLYDWSSRLRKAISKIFSFNTNTSVGDKIAVNEELLNLSTDFLLSAELYGKTIVSELFLPMEKRTIKPIIIGGVAGGEKYIVRNILFKFALDSAGIYGDDAAAAKVGGHELKGLSAYYNCFINNLNVPLIAIIDYRGFRLLAEALLPITKLSLCYGSADAGKTVLNSIPELSEKMDKAAKKLNLAPHEVNGVRLSCAGDVEGHVVNGVYYLLDLARVFPPEPPSKERPHKASHLFRLLRPELVKKYSKPLSSDALTGFGSKDPNKSVFNNDVKEAFTWLIDEVIPTSAKALYNQVKGEEDHSSFLAREAIAVWKTHGSKSNPSNISKPANFLSSFSLKQFLHAAGINMRHTGRVAAEIRRQFILEKDSPVYSDVTMLLFIEMIARTLRYILNRKYRRLMKELNVPLEEPYRLLLTLFLNDVFGNSEASTRFWNTTVKPALHTKFEGALSEEYLESTFDLRTLLTPSTTNFGRSKDGRYFLYLQLKRLTGFSFAPAVDKEVKSKSFFNQEEPFDEIDIESIGTRVKDMHLVNHARGYIYKMRASGIRDTNPNKALSLLSRARENFEEVLESNPINPVTLRNNGQVCQQMQQLREGGVEKLSKDQQLVRKADEYFRRAVIEDPNGTHSLYQYGQFLEKCGRTEEANEYLLRSLEADPNHVAALVDYCVLLTKNNYTELAKQLHARIPPDAVMYQI